jgi:threonine/homoserine/homoserine lactone efflux protein
MICRSIESIAGCYTVLAGCRVESPLLLGQRGGDTVVMHIFLLGIAIGLVTLLPPGPLGMTVVGLGTRRGRRAGVRAGLGIASADIVLGCSALLFVGAGAALPAAAFTALRAFSIVVLVAFGLLLVVRASTCFELADRIGRPARSLFALTLVSPLSIVSWIALLAAMPFSTEPGALALFSVGIITASFLWHPVLGAAAGHLGSRLNDRGARVVSRIGGSCLIGVGLIAFSIG